LKDGSILLWVFCWLVSLFVSYGDKGCLQPVCNSSTFCTEPKGMKKESKMEGKTGFVWRYLWGIGMELQMPANEQAGFKPK